MILSISLTILLAKLCYSTLHSRGSFHPLENYNSDLFQGDILLRNGTFGKEGHRTDFDFTMENSKNTLASNGCFSELGKVGGVQSLSLESDICMKKGVILHEMMHSLGFLHEQTRYDRDDHVRVLWDNIVPGMEPNFSKMRPSEIDLLDLGYDYESIMHYGAYMFAQDRSLPTLKPTNEHVPLRQLGYGQAQGVFSELDIQKINKFYECDL
ncbi:Zinc metalloproteinase nas-15 like protein [Argiope bruennichi]|uniref:Metalloendopeptidase n=1 Tax=Argiope bruennichi TaxID=94029 RepID=A0A8T0G122_ARGBR|nr:Zinc metalloproteinase nas-15 like protein [Argiope bruennichi]